jgi:ornithine carbamoyltransferase
MLLRNKDIISTQYLSMEEIACIFDLAIQMKRDRYNVAWSKLLYQKTFLMFFFNPSVRTRISFETAALELGGHAIYLVPSMGRFKDKDTIGESIEDAAQVMSQYVAGIGIRVEDKGSYYGEAHELLLEYAKWASVPVINMADDKFHPCQGLSDLLGWAEWFGDGGGYPDFERLKGKNLLVTWARGSLHRSRTSPQETIMLASRMGMNITLARPEGYDLDPQVYAWVKENCSICGTNFNVIDNPDEGYVGAHVVYSRNWISENAYQDGCLQKETEISKSLRHIEWMATMDRMKKTNEAIFTHPMPVDRGSEVEDVIASGSHSVIYQVAENRLHIQKATMALTMGRVAR